MNYILIIGGQELERGSFYGPSNYDPILNLFGEIKIRMDDNNYQGDTRVLYYQQYQGGERWGYLIFGWGSCSGCDALQGCATMAEIQELIDNLRHIESSGLILWGN